MLAMAPRGFAQAPAPDAAAPAGGTQASTDLGTIDTSKPTSDAGSGSVEQNRRWWNGQYSRSAKSSRQTLMAAAPGGTDITSQPAGDAAGDAADAASATGDDNSKPLPNTGGEPLLFVLVGSMLIGGGLVLRYKLTQAES